MDPKFECLADEEIIKTSQSKCLQDSYVTFSEEVQEESNLLQSAPVFEVELAYYFLRKIPTTVNDVDEELTKRRQSAPHIPQLMEELMKLGGDNIDLDKSAVADEVEFILEALLHTCNERLFMNETITLQNGITAILEKDLDTNAETVQKKLDEFGALKFSSYLESTGENQVPDNGLTPEAVLAFHFLKQVPAENDPDEVFSSLKQELTEGKLSMSNLTCRVNELNQIEGKEHKGTNQDVEALKIDVEFVLKVLELMQGKEFHEGNKSEKTSQKKVRQAIILLSPARINQRKVMDC